MKFSIRRLGPIKEAELELGQLTVLCGKNNTGKTYVAHAISGFIKLFSRRFEVKVEEKYIDSVLKNGFVVIPIEECISSATAGLEEFMKKFSTTLPKIMASSPKKLSDTDFSLSISESDLTFKIDKNETSGTNLDAEDNAEPEDEYFSTLNTSVLEVFTSFTIDKGNHALILKINNTKSNKERNFFNENYRFLADEIITNAVTNFFKENILSNALPYLPKGHFMASAERSGIVIFQRELDFNKSRLFDRLASLTLKERINNSDSKKALSENQNEIFELLESSIGPDQRYSLAVRDNIDFVRSIPDLRSESMIAQEYPDIINAFSEIIGGRYEGGERGVRYIPDGQENGDSLSLSESSGTVRALVDIGFYLRRQAKPGDLLMIDEPELNLHPENQRKLARLFVRLINAGVHVFITTHSDYFIRELNTLIKLNKDDARIKEIAAQNGYKEQELLDHKKLKVYVTTKLDGGGYTLTPSEITEDHGAVVESFNETIRDMNSIRDDINWGS